MKAANGLESFQSFFFFFLSFHFNKRLLSPKAIKVKEKHFSSKPLIATQHAHVMLAGKTYVGL